MAGSRKGRDNSNSTLQLVSEKTGLRYLAPKGFNAVFHFFCAKTFMDYGFFDQES